MLIPALKPGHKLPDARMIATIRIRNLPPYSVRYRDPTRAYMDYRGKPTLRGFRKRQYNRCCCQPTGLFSFLCVFFLCRLCRVLAGCRARFKQNQKTVMETGCFLLNKRHEMKIASCFTLFSLFYQLWSNVTGYCSHFAVKKMCMRGLTVKMCICFYGGVWSTMQMCVCVCVCVFVCLCKMEKRPLVALMSVPIPLARPSHCSLW